MDYSAYLEDAITQLKTLPEEKGELYKRYYVMLKLDKFAEKLKKGGNGAKDDVEVQKTVAGMEEALRKKFDIVVWETGAKTDKTSKYVKVIDSKSLSSQIIEKKMVKSSDDRIAAFLNAYSSRVIMIDIPENITAKLNLMFLCANGVLPVQIFVNVGKEASLSLFEYYASQDVEETMVGSINEIRMGSFANAEINMIHNESQKTTVIAMNRSTSEESSDLKLNAVYNGGGVTKARSTINANGYLSKVEVNELLVSSGEQKQDISTMITNSAKSSHAVLESKAVLMDRSSCLLKGFATIAKDAGESRSYVNERGIILDKDAHIDSIPGMSIGTNNVKATHSSATAPIDEEAIFYLMSRGADELSAKKAIVNGFLSGGIAKINDIIAREIVASIVNEKMTSKKYGFIPKITTESMWLAGSAHTSASTFKGHYKYRGE